MIPVSMIQSEVKSFLKNQTVGTQVLTWIQLSLSEILSEHNYWWNKKNSNLTTTSGIAEYILDHRVEGKQVLWMGDTSNRTREITECLLEDIYGYDSTPTTTGQILNWAFVKKSYVQAITTVADTVSVVSSSTSDTSASIIITGRVSGIEKTETLALNGTTTVDGTLTFDADGIESVSLTSACAGSVTLTDSANTIVVIPAGYTRIEAPRIRLWYVPGSTLTLPYIYYQKAILPASSNDTVDIPEYAFDALMTGIEKYGHRNNGDYDLSLKVHQVFMNKIDNLWAKSKKEANKINRKDFAQSGDKMVYTMPRTVTYTVT